jgi:hypothetical protein
MNQKSGEVKTPDQVTEGERNLVRVTVKAAGSATDETCGPGLSVNSSRQQLRTAFGTQSAEAAEGCFWALVEAARRKGGDLPTEDEINSALALLQGMEPRDEAEAMLVSQMVSIYNVAMDLLAQSQRGHHWKYSESCANLANRLFRTFTAQFEALAKYRRGGQQTKSSSKRRSVATIGRGTSLTPTLRKSMT